MRYTRRVQTRDDRLMATVPGSSGQEGVPPTPNVFLKNNLVWFVIRQLQRLVVFWRFSTFGRSSLAALLLLLLAVPAIAADKVRVAMPTEGFLYTPLYLAIDAGLMKEVGIDAHLIQFRS